MTAAPAFTPTFTKYIGYDRLTKDYAAYLDGEVIGFYATYHEAEVALDAHVADLQAAGLDRTATELDGGAPAWEAVAPIDPAAVEPSEPPVDDGPDDNWGGFRCGACNTSDYGPSAMQPAVCYECVQAWLEGYSDRLDPRYLALRSPVTGPAQQDGGEYEPLCEQCRIRPAVWSHAGRKLCGVCVTSGPDRTPAPAQPAPALPAEMCEHCRACPATWEVRERGGMYQHICNTCYRNEFEENPDRHWTAWEAQRLPAPTLIDVLFQHVSQVDPVEVPA